MTEKQDEMNLMWGSNQTGAVRGVHKGLRKELMAHDVESPYCRITGPCINARLNTQTITTHFLFTKLLYRQFQSRIILAEMRFTFYLDQVSHLRDNFFISISAKPRPLKLTRLNRIKHTPSKCCKHPFKGCKMQGHSVTHFKSKPKTQCY